jgi:hypothetical protein
MESNRNGFHLANLIIIVLLIIIIVWCFWWRMG